MPKTNKPVRAVLFDLGMVILRFDFGPAFRKLARSSGRRPGEIAAFFTRSGLEVLYDGGRITSREFYRRVKRGIGHGLTYAEFCRAWNEIFTPNAGIVRLIRRLKGRTRLVLVSNTNAMHYRYIRAKYPVLGHFRRAVLSYRLKVRKPDPRIYMIAARACGADPTEIFYIDDREDLTAAAGDLGFRTFTFKNNLKDLLRRMAELEIAC